MHLPSPRALRNYIIRLFICIAGLFLFAVGTVFTFRSKMGLGPWDVLHLGISRHTPLTFGQATIVVGAIIILVGLLLRAYPGVATILNMILIGIFVDLQLHWNWLPDFSSAPLLVRLLIDAVGVFIIGIGTALYISPRLGAGPRDGLMMRLHALTKTRIAIVRALIECCALVVGFFLGGTVGIGTLIFAFGVGPCVEVGFYLIKRFLLITGLGKVEVPIGHVETAKQVMQSID
ncbi:MAG: membrane protein [Ktedonobacteraceae bacterium]